MRNETRLSGLDQRLVETLRKDGRLPTAEIARLLGAAETTVRKRLAGLLKDEVMRIVAVVSTRALGYTREVQFIVRTTGGAPIEVAERFVLLDEVRFVAFCVGPYDLVINAVFRDERDLFDFVTGPLSAPDIASYESMDVLAVFKRTFDWLADRELLNPQQTEKPQPKDATVS